MKEWWENLSLRERLLVGGAGTVTALVVLIQFVTLPALSARADARSEHAEAVNDLALVDSALEREAVTNFAASTDQPGRQALTPAQFKAGLTSSATQRGLSISRVQGGDDGRIGLVFERADPRILFFWLEEVERDLNGSIRRMSVEQVGDGLVRASIDLTLGGAA